MGRITLHLGDITKHGEADATDVSLLGGAR